MFRALGRYLARKSSAPNLSIIAAHILWIDKNAATEGQAIDSASKTKVASSLVRPDPPLCSRTQSPPNPSSANCGQRVFGISPAVSQSRAKGAIWVAPKSRAISKIAVCSSEREKSMGAVLWLLMWQVNQIPRQEPSSLSCQLYRLETGAPQGPEMS